MDYVLSTANFNEKLQALLSIRKSLKDKDYEEISIDFSQKEFLMSQLIEEASTIPLLSKHKLILVESADFLTSKGKLSKDDEKLFLDYLKDKSSFTSLVLITKYPLDKRKKIVKETLKVCELIEFKALNDWEKKQKIKDDLRQSEIIVDEEAFEMLSHRVLKNYDVWPSELEKLEIYNKKELKLADVEALISDHFVDDVFEISNALIHKDLDQTLSLWQTQPQAQKDPIAMMMLLASQYRLMYQIKVLLDQGYYQKDIARELAVHPYRIQKLAPLVHNYSTKALLKILSELSELDQKIKSGKVIAEQAFELFLVRVSIE